MFEKFSPEIKEALIKPAGVTISTRLDFDLHKTAIIEFCKAVAQYGFDEVTNGGKCIDIEECYKNFVYAAMEKAVAEYRIVRSEYIPEIEVQEGCL